MQSNVWSNVVAILLILSSCVSGASLGGAQSHASSIGNFFSSIRCKSLRAGSTDCSEAGAQTLFNNLNSDGQYETIQVDGASIVEAIETKFQSLFSKKTAVIEAIESAASTALSPGAEVGSTDLSTYYSAEPGIGRGLPPVVKDGLFGGKYVARSNSVFKLAPSVSSTSEEVRAAIAATSALDSTFVNNLQTVDEESKWQYFASKLGVTRVFPGFEWDSGCSGGYASYEPRTRPWYVLASSGPKDIVVIIDTSGSMSTAGRMSKAREAAIAVVDTASANDYINVVAFSSSSSTPSCFPSRLVRATSENKKQLVDWIGTLSAGGGTDFVSAFTKAFDLVDATAAVRGSNCKTAMVFLTDGQASDPTSLINSRNTADINAVIMSFTLGSGADQEIPRKVAEDNSGLFSHINDGGDLLTEMSYYYLYLAYSIQSPSVQWTAPYIDSWGLGLMVTGAKGVYSAADGSGHKYFLGVAATDVVLPQLLSVVQSYELALSIPSYTFILNEDGEALVHPFAASPYSATANEPIYTDIDDLEGAEFESAEVRAAILNSDATVMGTTLTVQRPVPRGDAEKEGLTGNAVTKSLAYFYQRITSTPFFLCLVLEGTVTSTSAPVSDWRIPAKSLKQLASIPACNGGSQAYCEVTPQLFHRIDLSPTATSPNVEIASSASEYAPGTYLTKNAVGWAAAPSSFNSPDAYLAGLPFSSMSVSAINTWAEDGTIVPATLGGGMTDANRQYLRLVSRMEREWSSVPSNETQGIWNYMGLANGLLLLYPGTPVNNSFYDPRIRSWYLRAVSENAGTSTLSTPYQDAFGAGTVLTLSTRIVAGGETGTPNAASIGVAAIDFKLVEFASHIGSLTGDCSGSNVYCYVIDKSGYIIYQENFASSLSSSYSYEYRFLGDVGNEPAVWAHLYCNGDVSLSSQDSYVAEASIKYYSVDVTSPTSRSFNFGSSTCTGDVYIVPIASSNAYFVQVERSGFGCDSSPSSYGSCSFDLPAATPFVSSTCAAERLKQCPPFSSSACNAEDDAICQAEKSRVMKVQGSRSCPAADYALGKLLIEQGGGAAGSGLSLGAIIGIAVGGAILLIIIIGIAVKSKSRRKDVPAVNVRPQHSAAPTSGYGGGIQSQPVQPSVYGNPASSAAPPPSYNASVDPPPGGYGAAVPSAPPPSYNPSYNPDFGGSQNV